MRCLFAIGLRATHLKNMTNKLVYSRALSAISGVGSLAFLGSLYYYTLIMPPNVKGELALAFVVIISFILQSYLILVII